MFQILFMAAMLLAPPLCDFCVQERGQSTKSPEDGA